MLNDIKNIITKDELIKLFCFENLTEKQIAKMLNCNRDTISYYYKNFKNNNHIEYNNSTYNYNEKIFEEINTPEKAYWLGFITADGCICISEDKNRISYRLQITLSEKDQNHLKKFINFIGDDSINISKSKVYLEKTQKFYNINSIKINNKNIVLDFLSWIYKDANVFLDRKKEIYDLFINKRYSPTIQGKPEEIGRNDLSPENIQE